MTGTPISSGVGHGWWLAGARWAYTLITLSIALCRRTWSDLILHIYTVYINGRLSEETEKIKGKFSGSRSRSATPRPSIHQSGDNANMRMQTYNDVGGDQITYITNFGGMLWVIQYKQNLTVIVLKQGMAWCVCFHPWSHAMLILRSLFWYFRTIL